MRAIDRLRWIKIKILHLRVCAVCKTLAPTNRINGILLISFVETVMDIQTCFTRRPARIMGLGIVMIVVSFCCLLHGSTLSFSDTSSFRVKPISIIVLIILNI